jgi:hypothetical protein
MKKNRGYQSAKFSPPSFQISVSLAILPYFSGLLSGMIQFYPITLKSLLSINWKFGALNFLFF